MRVERGRGVSYLVSNLRGEAEEKLFEASPLPPRRVEIVNHTLTLSSGRGPPSESRSCAYPRVGRVGKDFWPVLAMLLFVVRRIRASVLLFEYSAVRLKLCRSNPKTLRIESSDSTNLTVQYCRSGNFFEQHPPSIFPASNVYRLLADETLGRHRRHRH